MLDTNILYNDDDCESLKVWLVCSQTPKTHKEYTLFHYINPEKYMLGSCLHQCMFSEYVPCVQQEI